MPALRDSRGRGRANAPTRGRNQPTSAAAEAVARDALATGTDPKAAAAAGQISQMEHVVIADAVRLLELGQAMA